MRNLTRHRATHALLALAGSALLGAACSGAPERPGPVAAAATPVAVTQTSENPYPGTRRRRGRNGETLYCWDHRPVGSKIHETTCATEQEMADRSSNARRALDEMRGQAGTTGGCTPGTGAGC